MEVYATSIPGRSDRHTSECLVLSGKGVVVPLDLYINRERLEHQELLQPQVYGLGHPRQGGCHQDFNLFQCDLVIPLRVLASEIGVDRHLRLAASADCRNEIDGYPTAFVADVLEGLVGYVQVHHVPPDPQWLSQTMSASIPLDAVGAMGMQAWFSPAMWTPASW